MTETEQTSEVIARDSNNIKRRVLKYCECGCGKEVKERDRFIHTHPWNKGLKNIYSPESLKKMSIAKKGRPTWMKGKHHSEVSKRRISESLKGHTSWSKNKKISLEKYPNWGMTGRHHSDKTKKKLSESKKGLKGERAPHFGHMHPQELYPNYGMRGKHHSLETRNKISLSHKNKHLSEETKNKMRLARVYKKFPTDIYPNYGMRGKTLPETAKQKIRMRWQEPKFKEKRSVLSKQMWQNPELRESISKSIRQSLQNPIYRKKKSEITKQLWQSSEYRDVCIKAQNQFWKKPQSRENRSKLSKQMWLNSEYRNKIVKAIMKGAHKRPTRPERILIDMIHQHNLPFKYTGDGKIIINGRCPDFVHNSECKIILCNGIYWHLERFLKEYPSLTKETVEDFERKPYNDLGYQVLFIWEDELKEPINVLNKILIILKNDNWLQKV